MSAGRGNWVGHSTNTATSNNNPGVGTNAPSSLSSPSRPNSFIKANPTWESTNNSPSPLSPLHPNRKSIQEIQPNQELNPNLYFPFQLKESLVSSLKQSLLDKTVDKITNFSLGFLVDGLKVKNGITKEDMWIRITDDLKYFEYVSSVDSSSKSEKVSVSNIAEVIEESNRRIKLDIKEQVLPIILEIEEKYSYIFALDALKSLIGFPLQSNEMQELLNVLTEVKALATLYPHPTRPSVTYPSVDASQRV